MRGGTIANVYSENCMTMSPSRGPHSLSASGERTVGPDTEIVDDGHDRLSRVH